MMEEVSHNMQRGHCHRCAQQWVLGKVEPNIGDYGTFFCAACWDEAISGEGSDANEEAWGSDDEPINIWRPFSDQGSSAQKRLKVTTPWQQLPEDEYQELERRRWAQDGLMRGQDIPQGLSLQRILVGRVSDRPREVRLVSDVLHQQFRSCGASLWLSSRVLLNFLEEDLLEGPA
ncbi:unnamed protein product, partial [Polarella glacialis]